MLTQKNQETTLFWQELTTNLFFRINYKTSNIRECYNRWSKFGMKVIPNQDFHFRNKNGNMYELYSTAPGQIVMYTTAYCSDCRRAKKFFEANNIPHLRVGLEGNAEATDFVMKINNGYKSVPTIVFPDGSVLVEPDWEELKAKFSNS